MIRSVVVVSFLAAASSALAEDVQVRSLAAGEEGACQHLSHNVCSTTSLSPEEECLTWHREEAHAAGADALMMGSAETSRRNKPSLTGMKTVITSKIPADYYRCAVAAPAGSAAPVVAAPAASASGVEERLQVLESLKGKGLISAEEYQQKRKEILADL